MNQRPDKIWKKKLFEKRVERSQAAVVIVAFWLQKLGYRVDIEGNGLAGNNPDYTDLRATKDGKSLLFEVKHMHSVRFTNADDWPKIYNGMFVSNVPSADERAARTKAWIILSGTCRHIAIIDSTTKPYWRIVTKVPKNTGKIENFYSCPLEHIRFKQII